MTARPRTRRISGPLAYLPEDLQGGFQQTQNFVETGHSQDGHCTPKDPAFFVEPPDEEEPSSPFHKGPWMTLCESFGIAVMSGPNAGNSIREALGGTISDVLDGKCGLRVPKLVGVATSVTHGGDGSVTILLTDPTGSSVSGYLHEELVEEYGPDLVAGFAIALHKVSLLVSGPGVQRWLNITPANVIGFFPKALEAEADTDGGAERWQGGVASTETTTSLLVPPGRAREGLVDQDGLTEQMELVTVGAATAGGGGGRAMMQHEEEEEEEGRHMMFGWESEQRRAEAISVFASSSSVLPHASPPTTGPAFPMRRDQGHSHHGQHDDGEDEEEGYREHEAESGRRRRDIWSMDVDDDDEEEGFGFQQQQEEGRAGQGLLAAVPETVAAAAAEAGGQASACDWEIGDDCVLRPATSSSDQADRHQDDDHSEEEEDDTEPWRLGGGGQGFEDEEDEDLPPELEALLTGEQPPPRSNRAALWAEEEEEECGRRDGGEAAGPVITVGSSSSRGGSSSSSQPQQQEAAGTSGGLLSRFFSTQAVGGGASTEGQEEEDALGGILDEDEALW